MGDKKDPASERGGCGSVCVANNIGGCGGGEEYLAAYVLHSSTGCIPSWLSVTSVPPCRHAHSS